MESSKVCCTGGLEADKICDSATSVWELLAPASRGLFQPTSEIELRVEGLDDPVNVEEAVLELKLPPEEESLAWRRSSAAKLSRDP